MNSIEFEEYINTRKKKKDRRVHVFYVEILPKCRLVWATVPRAIKVWPARACGGADRFPICRSSWNSRRALQGQYLLMYSGTLQWGLSSPPPPASCPEINSTTDPVGLARPQYVLCKLIDCVSLASAGIPSCSSTGPATQCRAGGSRRSHCTVPCI